MEPIQTIEVDCPYCGESVTIAVEADLSGDLVQDCEVCCNPWRLRLTRVGEALEAHATTEDD